MELLVKGEWKAREYRSVLQARERGQAVDDEC